jgi:hypothetical protein
VFRPPTNLIQRSQVPFTRIPTLPYTYASFPGTITHGVVATGRYADALVALDVSDLMHERGRAAAHSLSHYRPKVPTHTRSLTFGFSIVHP